MLWSVHVSFYLHGARKLVQWHNFGWKKIKPVRYRNRTFQKFESILYRITMFTFEASQYNLYRIASCTTSWGGSGLITAGMAVCMGNIPGATSLTFAFNPFLKH